jgi:hypothetical protein
MTIQVHICHRQFNSFYVAKIPTDELEIVAVGLCKKIKRNETEELPASAPDRRSQDAAAAIFTYL